MLLASYASLATAFSTFGLYLVASATFSSASRLAPALYTEVAPFVRTGFQVS
jgi:hypothetical protein